MEVETARRRIHDGGEHRVVHKNVELGHVPLHFPHAAQELLVAVPPALRLAANEGVDLLRKLITEILVLVLALGLLSILIPILPLALALALLLLVREDEGVALSVSRHLRCLYIYVVGGYSSLLVDLNIFSGSLV